MMTAYFLCSTLGLVLTMEFSYHTPRKGGKCRVWMLISETGKTFKEETRAVLFSFKQIINYFHLSDFLNHSLTFLTSCVLPVQLLGGADKSYELPFL